MPAERLPERLFAVGRAPAAKLGANRVGDDLRLLCDEEIARTRQELAKAAAALWFLPASAGILLLTNESLRVGMPDSRAFGKLQEHNVARFTTTGATDVFEGYVSRFHLPYPDPAELQKALSRPEVVASLPANFHPAPNPLEGASAEGACASPTLPPGISPPPGETRWISSFQREGPQEGAFTSGPFTPRTGAVRLWYLGMDSGGSLKPQLKPEGKGKAIPIKAERRHGTSTWEAITVDVTPGTTYRLEFTDKSRNGWAAMTMPVEEPPLSRLAGRLFASAIPLALTALAALAIALAAPASRSRAATRSSATPGPGPDLSES